MTKLKGIFELSTRVLTSSRDLVSRMQTPPGPPGRPICAIFLTMVEQFEATLLLSKAGLATYGATHARALIESATASRLLGLEPNHVDQMKFEQLRGEKRVYERALKLSELSSEHRQQLEERLASCKSRYQPLFDTGIRPAQIFNQFTNAQVEFLAAPYAMLCSFVHNDLAILAFRHQGEKGMKLREADDVELVFMALSIACFALIDGAHPLYEIARFPTGHFEHHFGAMSTTYRQLMDLSESDAT